MTLYSATRLDGPPAGPPAGPTDITPPVVTPISPAPNTVIQPSQAITFAVTDETALATVVVYASFAGTDACEVVHNGVGFCPNYSTGSVRTVIANGFSYQVRRFGGWPASPTITALPVDTSGNIA